MKISEALAQPLAQLHDLNQSAETTLRGGAYAITVERPEDGLPWIQAKTDTLNIFFPDSADPIPRLRACMPTLPSGLTCQSWEADKFATLEFSPVTVQALAKLIEDLFVHFYGFPAETEVSAEIFDMR